MGDLHEPFDYVILTIEEDTNILIILRRPFFTMPRCCIDVVKNGKLSLNMGVIM